MIKTRKTARPKNVSFRQVARRMAALPLPEVDLVVGIGESGAVAASLAAAKLGCELFMLPIMFRHPDNRPMFGRPRLRGPSRRIPAAKRVLLVDDVSVSGKTMALARNALKGRHVTTFVLKGKADLVLFPEITACVSWPWKG